jgi:hypothetical protein
VYLPSGQLLRSSEGIDARFVGSTLSITNEWQENRRLLATAIYSHLFPGEFIQETGPADSIDFMELTIQLLWSWYSLPIFPGSTIMGTPTNRRVIDEKMGCLDGYELTSCAQLLEAEELNEDATCLVILEALWQHLRNSYKLRPVK